MSVKQQVNVEKKIVKENIFVIEVGCGCKRVGCSINFHSGMKYFIFHFARSGSHVPSAYTANCGIQRECTLKNNLAPIPKKISVLVTNIYIDFFYYYNIKIFNTHKTHPNYNKTALRIGKLRK